jgi:hypothetical protein
MATRPGRPFAFWAAVGGTSLLSLTLLQVGADKFGGGLSKFRDYLVRRNG